MNKSIKMIVTDLDETFLRSDKTVSDHTKKVFQSFHDKGIKIAYATGRGNSAERIAPYDFFDGKIIMNGAIARAGDDIVYNRLIPYMTARPLLMACDRRGLKTASQFGGMQYANFIVSDVWPYITWFEKVDFSKHALDAENLYMLVDNRQDVAFIEKHLPDELWLTVSRDGLAMVMHKDATKTKALAELARVWGIKQSEIAAFGDDLNDIDMLEYAGVGVAMSNALDEVKAAAGCVMEYSNDDDGGARWIEENIFVVST